MRGLHAFALLALALASTVHAQDGEGTASLSGMEPFGLSVEVSELSVSVISVSLDRGLDSDEILAVLPWLMVNH